MIALVEARRAGLLRRGLFLPNIISGLIVGVVALPLGMAFAIASGAKPEQGLYTSIVAGLAVSVFGGSRVQIDAPRHLDTVQRQVVDAPDDIQNHCERQRLRSDALKLPCMRYSIRLREFIEVV